MKRLKITYKDDIIGKNYNYNFIRGDFLIEDSPRSCRVTGCSTMITSGFHNTISNTVLEGQRFTNVVKALELK